jgi:hypothetical protein
MRHFQRGLPAQFINWLICHAIAKYYNVFQFLIFDF